MKINLRKTLKVLSIIAVSLIILFAAFVGWVWFSTFHPGQVESVPAANRDDAPLISERDELKILNWNVQFMAGEGYYFYYEGGPDTRPSTEDIAQTTREVAGTIKEEDPDIVLLQEVDDGAKRTDHEDQLEKLLALLPNEYGSHSSAFYWRAAFSPHPKILGSVGMKLSVISKYRMENPTRYQLALKPDNWFVKQFDLKRAVLEVRFPRESGKDLVVMNTHLTAFAFGSDVRTRQVKEIRSLLEERTSEDNPWVIGGDFNLQPPGSGAKEVEVIEPLFEEYQAIPGLGQVKGPNPENWYTHFPNDPEIDSPNKTIDYFFLSNDVSIENGYVMQENTLNISDHLPVVVEIRLSGT